MTWPVSSCSPPDAIPDLSSLLKADLQAVTRAVERIASAWNVSEPAVAYRFARNGWIEGAIATALFKIFADRWRREKQRARETRNPDDQGPSYYVVRRLRGAPASSRIGITRRRAKGITGRNADTHKSSEDPGRKPGVGWTSAA